MQPVLYDAGLSSNPNPVARVSNGKDGWADTASSMLPTTMTTTTMMWQTEPMTVFP